MTGRLYKYITSPEVMDWAMPRRGKHGMARRDRAIAKKRKRNAKRIRTR